MKNKGKLLLTLFLITWAVFSIVLFVKQAPNYLVKSYFQSDTFQSTKESFIDQLGHYVLMPFDAEKAKETINVTQGEIEEYRYRYGSLTEQVESIQSQYRGRIMEAEESKDSTLKELLIEERDKKIADIKANFESDDYVKEKIRKQKEQLIDEYAAEQEKYKKSFLNEFSYFSYHFVNIDNGKKFESGTQQKSDLFTESYEDKNPLIVNNSVNINSYDNNVYSEVQDTIPEFQIDGESARYEGSFSIPKSMLSSSNLGTDYQYFNIAKITFIVIWVTGILAIVGLFTFARPKMDMFRESSNVKDAFLRLPIDVRIILIIVVSFISFGLMEYIGNSLINNIIYFNPINLITSSVEELIFLFIVFISVAAIIFGITWTWDSIKNEPKIEEQLKNAMLYRLADGLRDLFLNRSLGVQSVAILIIFFLAGIGFVGASYSVELLMIYILLLFFIGLPAGILFLRRIGYLNRIMRQTEDMARGRLTNDIKVKGKSPLAKHAANLNALREGVKKSMSEQAKSERLKTELITNVSHDLRTPLTSIITYTDLLKNPDLTDEQRKQYIDVLDKKSARLKTLIEDLFEVSKMASGNIEITKQKLDLTQLVQQAIGEHEEAFSLSNLELRILMPEEPLYAYVDGQKMWRVIDNLIVNTLKYSLEGTRVYVTLKQIESNIEFSVKNVSKYELNENVQELTERFKRADASRHTDGSGLGLAIAQSIVDLHNGRLTVEVDGDLFKVTVTIVGNS
ncbi:histidine kinase dimerization/phospho-acceptor domain-containing protein [Ureibacillus sp. 179-F W5.1 NHS]|uniref:histidine kinase n=1 Tax=Lysinibacillus halotolerans TaxID=1368476 RepID=A0A3M8HA63_9BACI|nr:HAMP domain-containing sensor histidine kinase [Lysinibacillus halotolerans]RNC99327.1 hypothetical protein EC501_08280 [Lysinibacillus halotolerans]